MTTRTAARCLGLAALAFLVTSCDAEPTHPSGAPEGLAMATAPLEPGRVPFDDQQVWDIVDENGNTIWQRIEDAPFSGGHFRLEANGYGRYEECDAGQTETIAALDCLFLWHTTVSTDRQCLEDAVYPIAQVTFTAQCEFLQVDAGIPINPGFTFRVTAAPTAPGNRHFRRWEVSIGDDAMPCAEGPGSLTCTVVSTKDYPGGVGPFFRLVYGPQFAFSGFLAPVDNAPQVNLAKAGSAVPVKFQLGGDQGLGILAEGSPNSQPVECDLAPGSDAIETTVSAKASELSYDAATGTYTYVWKTRKEWSGSCRAFRMTLTDGQAYEAQFRFAK